MRRKLRAAADCKLWIFIVLFVVLNHVLGILVIL